MATTMPVMTNLCDCSLNGLKFWSPCTPQIGAVVFKHLTANEGSNNPSNNIIDVLVLIGGNREKNSESI